VQKHQDIVKTMHPTVDRTTDRKKAVSEIKLVLCYEIHTVNNSHILTMFITEWVSKFYVLPKQSDLKKLN